ncbi:carbohydrate ABC transporter permease [Promicromonospora thailandica]|uniref:Cellobiose ABC transporter membrane protein n=1 Tax=Promicromonospora thailandica TaxID=765201 RepID=A0A9X2JXS0_9MICO|nr:sugar ABC transporter permease [Promicromonospora thailandica]MCP2264424.1 cellobiose ABC transporter membrane protein [Promicromonospora thailandica]BFF20522.1 sugar ABC transporter permease [Promicromonospora thailandica]
MAVLTPQRSAPDAGAAGREPRRLGFSQRLGRWDVKLSPYLYISPFFILFAVTGLFPLAYTAYVSVHDWSLLGGQGDFVGLTNFSDVLAQPTFWKSLGNTLSIFVLSSVPQVLVAITIAALLDQNLRAATFWRMGVLVPYVVAPVAVSMIFGRLFADQYGLINSILTLIGMDPIAWHGDRLASHLAIATMVNYRWTGYNALIFLAAMQAVPRELYEAAVIDGAGRIRQFFSVTVPQIRATIIFVVITSTIGGLQIFDEVRMFDVYGLGGPDQNWMTTVVYLYDLAWGDQHSLGRASAVAWLLFLLIILIGLINFLVTRRISTSDAAPKTTRKSSTRGNA